MKADKHMFHDAQRCAAVPSPCTGVCEMDAASGYCRGCLRTIGEISGWSAAGDDAKRAIWAELDKRRQSLL